MAIYGVGAKYGNDDVSEEFIKHNVIGTGWDITDAPELHEYFKSLKVGDIVYIKSANPSSAITVKGIGIIIDNIILNSTNNQYTEIGRNVKWLNTDKFIIQKYDEKNNVRMNTIYEEFHPDVQNEIIGKIIS